MGRGSHCKNTSPTKSARKRSQKSQLEETLGRYELLVGRWERRIDAAGANNKDTFEDKLTSAARALQPLAKPAGLSDQKMLVRAAQDAKLAMEEIDDVSNPLYHRAKKINDRARSIFILCHSGFIEQHISRQVHQLSGESPQDAREVLRQEAREGINHGIDKYQFDQGAVPLTYMHSWIRARITAAGEREGGAGGVRAKSKANDLKKKIQTVAKEIESSGRQVTVAEIADKVNAPVDRVAELLPWATKQIARLDAPINNGDGGETTFGALIIDTSQTIEEPVFDADTYARIRQAVSELPSPLQRRIIELCCGLAGNGKVEQKDLFDGVYRDPETGKAYSAEPSVISDRAKRGEKVVKAKQRELNERFKEGKLCFEPGTDESHELARVGKHGDNYDPAAPYEPFITVETGMPPTSGTIQEAKRKAEDFLRSNPLLAGLAPRYRGDNELENSEIARQRVRDALRKLEVIDASDESKLMASRAQKGGKSKLREIAEAHGLVDEDSGRLDSEKIASVLSVGSSEEDLSELMSS